MQHRYWLAPFVFLCALPYLYGQGSMGSLPTGNVKVHVVYENERRAGGNLLVQLIEGSSNTPVASTFTNDDGLGAFYGVAVGMYHIVVSGNEIQTVDSGLFEVDNRRSTQTQFIYVHQLASANGDPAPGKKSAAISAVALKVPDKARKEFDKANDDMAHQDWKKALERLHKAVEIYPSYAAAYTNLGVVYSHLNDDAHEQEALQKAITLDDHFAPAYVNLAKLYIRQHDFMQAEPLLDKAGAADPGNPDTLLLLATAQYMNHKYDAAIVTANQAHNAAGPHSPVVHYIVGRASLQKNRPQDALTAFELFLKEEPQGQRADQVRAVILKMQSSAESASVTSH